MTPTLILKYNAILEKRKVALFQIKEEERCNPVSSVQRWVRVKVAFLSLA